MSKRLIGLIAISCVAVIALFGISRAKLFKPKTDLALASKSTESQLARGEYLANHVAVCMDCHSQRDWNYYSAPILAGTEGMGGMRFGPEWGMPGNIYSKNITPAGIGHWSNDEIITAMTRGINKDGEILFPLMPYPYLRQLSTDDLHSIIAYIRSLKPIPNEVRKRELFIPIEAVMPAPLPEMTPSVVDKSNTVEYGRYLVTIAACADCHTPMEQGEFIEGMEFAGGYPFELPGCTMVYSQNITPDVETGIGGWDRHTFITIFKAYSDAGKHRVKPGDFNTIMPWSLFSGMTEEDLGAIYDYLRTVKPVKNTVDRFVKKAS